VDLRRGLAAALIVTTCTVAGCTGAGEALPPPPCDGETWGAIEAPADAVHVRADGDDAAGDGTRAAPLATVAAAFDLGGPIAVGPGTFPTTLALGEADGGFAIQGCSADETALVGDEEGAPILSFSGTADASVAGLSLAEADRPLFVWSGAEVSAHQIAIRDARWSGFVVDGPYTILELEDVTVQRTQAVGGAGGFGGEVDGGTLRWTGGEAVGNVGAGLVGAGATAVLELDGVRVAETAPADDGRFGRGVQVQDYARATLRSCTVAANHDAGVFSLLATDLVVEDLVVEDTAAGLGGGGDGIVVTAIDASGRQLDPAGFTATLTANAIAAPGRAGIVLERVTGTVDGNTVSGAGAQDIVAQSGAVVTGADAVEVLAEPLVLDREAIIGVGAP
jgi:hypothetical protein